MSREEEIKELEKKLEMFKNKHADNEVENDITMFSDLSKEKDFEVRWKKAVIKISMWITWFGILTMLVCLTSFVCMLFGIPFS